MHFFANVLFRSVISSGNVFVHPCCQIRWFSYSHTHTVYCISNFACACARMQTACWFGSLHSAPLISPPKSTSPTCAKERGTAFSASSTANEFNYRVGQTYVVGCVLCGGWWCIAVAVRVSLCRICTCPGVSSPPAGADVRTPSCVHTILVSVRISIGHQMMLKKSTCKLAGTSALVDAITCMPLRLNGRPQITWLIAIPHTYMNECRNPFGRQPSLMH